MAKKAYVYSGTDWVPLASEVTDLTPYQTIANSQAPFRNLIINGAMQVAQRGTSTASITGSGFYTADRYYLVDNGLGTWTQSLENDAPTGSGFVKSVKMLCTTADASPAASDILFFRQSLEGQNLQSVRKGTADAQQLTMSFWVKSNVTGTYILSLLDADNTRQISASYTIDSSATWEKKTITFPADTTGAFDNDNAASLRVDFWLATGSDFGGGTLNTSWGADVNANRAVGQTNLASATNNYWQITGVQLEVGPVATPFEFKPYAQDLLECQRYYVKFPTIGTGNAPLVGFGMCNSNGTVANIQIQLPTTMRSTPSAVETSSLRVNDVSNGYTISSPSLGNISTMNTGVISWTVTGGPAYRSVFLDGTASTAYVAFSAEL